MLLKYLKLLHFKFQPLTVTDEIAMAENMKLFTLKNADTRYMKLLTRDHEMILTLTMI